MSTLVNVQPRVEVAIDCRDLDVVGGFWTRLLGYRAPKRMDDIYLAAEDPGGVGPRLVFQRVNDEPVVKSPIHLDVHVDDPESWRARVLELGGTVLDAELIIEAGSQWLRCADPEGNVFCLVRQR